MNKEPKCWEKIDSLFLKYKEAFPNQEIRDELYCLVYSVYSTEFIRSRRPDWSDSWRDEIHVRWLKKFERVLDNPDRVKKGNDGHYKLTAFMTTSFFSTTADVYRHLSQEKGVVTEEEERRSGQKTLQQIKFEDLVWDEAQKLPGKQGEVFKLYMKGLENRASDEGLSKEFTIKGIASKLNLTPTGVATHIHRAKITLEHKLRHLGVELGVLSSPRCYR